MKKLLATAAIVATSAAATAADYNGAGFSIPDLGGGSSIINVPDSVTITDVNVSLNSLTHTWIGDLIVTLEHMGGGGTATIMSRVGATTSGGVGSGSNVDGTYTFDSQSANSIWAAAASTPVPAGTYYTTGALSSANNLSLNMFNGQNSSGNWRISISDHAGLDIGSLGGWTLSIVPEPTSLSLLALGGLALIRRR